MRRDACFGRRIGNTFPVELYIRTIALPGSLEDHVVSVILINETKGKRESVPCVVEGNIVKFNFTSALQYRLGGTGIYTPVLAVDAGDENLGEADWYKAIEIVPHSVQEYSESNSSVGIGPVVLQADLSLIASGLSAYEIWRAAGHSGGYADFIPHILEIRSSTKHIHNLFHKGLVILMVSGTFRRTIHSWMLDHVSQHSDCAYLVSLSLEKQVKFIVVLLDRPMDHLA